MDWVAALPTAAAAGLLTEGAPLPVPLPEPTDARPQKARGGHSIVGFNHRLDGAALLVAITADNVAPHCAHDAALAVWLPVCLSGHDGAAVHGGLGLATSYAFVGIDEVGVQVEQPFEIVPMTTICNLVLTNLEETFVDIPPGQELSSKVIVDLPRRDATRDASPSAVA